MIKTVGLVKNFGKIKAVNSVNLQVNRGEIFGLVGPDGAGKTTLMRMMCGLLIPDHGEISIMDRTPLEIKETAGEFGYMPQKFSLYGDLTVMENIEFYGSIYKIARNTIKERADQILEVTNLIDFKARLADQLSGGMRQKLALTCALITRPRLLILDEPTYGVDPESRKEFWRILYQLNQEGMTILVSTPYMDESELCHRVAFMVEGRVVAVDTPQNLKKRMNYEIIEIQINQKNPDVFKDIEGVLDCSFVGDCFHLMVDESEPVMKKLEKTLQAEGIQTVSMRTVPPTMEDVYLALVERGAEYGLYG